MLYSHCPHQPLTQALFVPVIDEYERLPAAVSAPNHAADTLFSPPDSQSKRIPHCALRSKQIQLDYHHPKASTTSAGQNPLWYWGKSILQTTAHNFPNAPEKSRDQ